MVVVIAVVENVCSSDGAPCAPAVVLPYIMKNSDQTNEASEGKRVASYPQRPVDVGHGATPHVLIYFRKGRQWPSDKTQGGADWYLYP